MDRKHNLLDALRQNLDLLALLPAFPSFLAIIEEHAPPPLSASAGQLKAKGPESWNDVLTRFWEAEPNFEEALDPAAALISWVFLQPYAEHLAELAAPFAAEGTPSCCPFCSRNPQVGVLRQEGDGAKRSLICSLCAHEWEYRRIVCPACGEENVNKLAVYSTEKFPQVRVEACDTCHSYIKSVDLTKDGHAVPVVDELATVPLNLWAADHGYAKLQPNLLGL
jgi:FdhE protein